MSDHFAVASYGMYGLLVGVLDQIKIVDLFLCFSYVTVSTLTQRNQKKIRENTTEF